MYKLVIPFLCLIAFSAQAKRQSIINAQNAEKHVNAIVQTGGRLTGSKSAKKAADYISSELKRMGLQPWQSQSYKWTFKFVSKIDKPKQQGTNLIAFIKGSTNLPAVIIGAHYDHLGHGKTNKSLAREKEQGKVHLGADDNASGVAGLLSIAEYLLTLKTKGKFAPKRDIVFAFWSGEELGLLGSKGFAKVFGQDDLSHIFMANLNLDMIGRLDNALILQGTDSSKGWQQIIEQRNAPVRLNIITQADSYLPTDASVFYDYHVPILSAFTGLHEQYHSPRDTAELLNYQGIAKIAKLMALIARGLALQEKALVYQQPSKKDKRTSRENVSIYLGTIPDYARDDGIGVLIGGAVKGSPAQQAGFQKGDVLIEMKGVKIDDVYDFTDVLQTLKVGKKITAKVMRNNKTIELEVIPGVKK